jgi:tetratricopeptide (TPR) repeat protein
LEQKIENTPILPEIKDQNTEKKEPVSETKQEKSAAQSIYDKIALFKQKKLQEQEQNKVKIEEIPALDTEMIEQKENTVQDEKSVTNHNDSKEITVPENIEQTPEEALPLHGKITENDIESIETIEETKELESSEIIDENLDENTEKNKKLIDKFIETEPKLDAKKEPELQGDVSKSSTVKKGEIITELMANIYINQAYYDKAIAIFEKLILKYPKKKSYFASKIEDLKKMM